MGVETEEFLAHYGVKGMKWGRRKAVGAARSNLPSTKAKVVQAKADYKAATSARKGEKEALKALNKARYERAVSLRDGIRTKSGKATVGVILASSFVPPLGVASYPAARIALRVNAKVRPKE